jgi:chromate transporter
MPLDMARLAELARLFLKLGTIGFGGPAAHIALMEDEVVRRRGWLTSQEFLDLVGATNVIPGPNSTELAIHIGRLRAGTAGLIVAGASFILPAAIIVTAIAWAYQRYGALPEATALLYGIKPVVIAIVFRALIGLGRTALKSGALVGVAVLALAAIALAHVHELMVLLGGAVAGAVIQQTVGGTRDRAGVAVAVPPWTFAPAAAVASMVPVTLSSLFLVFAKAGSVLFGSGYVLFALLRADLVERLGWLSDAQLFTAISVGQITPGPVFTTATFIGYLLAGGRGAAVATIGIFLPAFVFVALSAPLVPWLRRSPLAGSVLDGVNVASWALMTAVTAVLARDAIVDVTTGVLVAVSAALLFRTRINAAWLLLAGALVGLISRHH